MAVKKSKPEAAAPKAPEKKVATKSSASPKSSAVKAKEAAPAVATDTASKASTPKPSPVDAKAPAAKAAPKKVAAPVKLTDRQVDFLKQIYGAKDAGYLLEKKAEQRTIDALLDRKLIKKGAKDKTSGHFRYMVSKAGEKHLSTLPPA